MKSFTLILFVLLASPAAWATGSQTAGSGNPTLNELLAFFSSSPLSGLAGNGVKPTATTGSRRLKPATQLPRKDVVRLFGLARESGRGTSVPMFHQQMNTAVRAPGR